MLSKVKVSRNIKPYHCGLVESVSINPRHPQQQAPLIFGNSSFWGPEGWGGGGDALSNTPYKHPLFIYILKLFVINTNAVSCCVLFVSQFPNQAVGSVKVVSLAHFQLV